MFLYDFLYQSDIIRIYRFYFGMLRITAYIIGNYIPTFHFLTDNILYIIFYIIQIFECKCVFYITF